MLNLWRRHEKSCKYDSRDNLKCQCPVWIDWRIAGKRIQHSIGTRDWQVAQMRARQLEADGITRGNAAPTTIEQATKRFTEDAKSRGLRETSLYKYALLFKQLKAFTESRGIVFLAGLNLEELRAFRESWPNKSLSARKKLEYLRAFFRFCHESEWIKSNPAKVLKPPKLDNAPVLPFSEEDMQKILAACDSHPTPARGPQLKALVLLMRHSGLRLGDACTLRRDRINGEVLELATAKTGTKVRLPLKPEVLQALEKVENRGDYYFWSGVSKKRTCTNVWQYTFNNLFRRAGIQGHSHQLRHTFAVNLLQRGASMEDVSRLLGHQSIKVTERHYAAWTPARQDRLEEAVRRAW